MLSLRARRFNGYPFAALTVCVALALVFRRFVFVAWYPVVMSVVMASAFGLSLLRKESLCQAVARLHVPGGLLPPNAAPYCRKLTAIWCGVLLVNAVIATGTVFGPRSIWFAWNCALSYVLMGMVMGIEYLVRQRTFVVTFHTSGSTSTPKTIIKPFSTLAKEVAYHRDHTLATVLQHHPSILATIEPDHMYGQLWRVLLPQAAACPVDPAVIFTPESLLAKMRQEKDVLLITTPSFLSRFCAYAACYEIPHCVRAIITSGALLTADVSAAAKRVFGCAPIEIFGSTETGGVAWRQQGTDAQTPYDWTVFAPVRVTCTPEGCLAVTSPFSVPTTYVMGDGAELAPDGRHFKLLGRRDRLVKIAEQRVSLPEMEEKMRTLPGVRDAALVPLAGEHGTVLGAVLVVDWSHALQEGIWGLPPRGPLHKHTLALALRRQLLPLFPKGAVPRKYRFVFDLPRNAQGKVRVNALRQLFETTITEPFVCAAQTTATLWQGQLVFDAQAPYFQGHFPDFPILPGVVQVTFAQHFTELLLGHEVTLHEIKKMKFMQMIHPDEPVTLTLTRLSEGEVSYTYTNANHQLCSTGVLVLAV